MQTESNSRPKQTSAKPRAAKIRPEITRLPEITPGRNLARKFVRAIARLLVFLFLRVSILGKENYPRQGAALMVSNHLGDFDGVVSIAYSPRLVEYLAKSELYDLPVLGWLMRLYGMIWIHRGQPDRRALRAASQGLQEGRLVGIAPEGRESISGALEEGAYGAAYLAYKTGAMVVPATFTSTENKRIIGNILHLRKTSITVTIGKPFAIDTFADWRVTIETGTEKIMQVLASQLPVEYKGVYQNEPEAIHDRE